MTKLYSILFLALIVAGANINASYYQDAIANTSPNKGNADNGNYQKNSHDKIENNTIQINVD